MTTKKTITSTTTANTSEHDLKENIWEIAEKIKDKAVDLEEQLEKLDFIKDLLWSKCLAELVKKFLSNWYLWQLFGWAFIVFGGWWVLSIFWHWHHLFKEILFMLVWWISIIQWVGLIIAKKWTSTLSLINLLVILTSVALWLAAYHKFLFAGFGNTLWIVIISFAVLLLVIKAKERFKK